MPGGDRTGPRGSGPMSGRGAGYCAGFDTPGSQNPGFGRGRGLGFGRGQGFGRGRGPGRGRGQGLARGLGRGAGPGFGWGFAQGSGASGGAGLGRGGRGWRHMFWATGLPGWLRFGASGNRRIDADPQLEQQALAHRAAELESELARLRARLSELESREKESQA